MNDVMKLGELPTLDWRDIKETLVPKNVTDKEFVIFKMKSEAFGLNPVKREIYCVKYGDSPAQCIVAYDVYIKRADRTGKLDGWGVELGQDAQGRLATATVTIHRKDWSKPFVWTVEIGEFDKGQSVWKQMRNFMLKKVAIAQGFRLAFPDELGGMPYTQEEVSSFTPEPAHVESAPVSQVKELPVKPKESDSAKMITAFAEFGVTVAELDEYLGRPAVDCDKAGVKLLRDVYKSIKGGAAKEQYFGKLEPVAPLTPPAKFPAPDPFGLSNDDDNLPL